MKTLDLYKIFKKDFEESATKQQEFMSSSLSKIQENAKVLFQGLTFDNPTYTVRIAAGAYSVSISVLDKEDKFHELFKAEFLFEERDISRGRFFEISYYMTTCYAEDETEVQRLINLGKFTSYIKSNYLTIHSSLKTQLDQFLVDLDPYKQDYGAKRDACDREIKEANEVHNEIVLQFGSKYIGKYLQYKIGDFSIVKVNPTNVKILKDDREDTISKRDILNAISYFVNKEPELVRQINDEYLTKKSLKNKIESL